MDIRADIDDDVDSDVETVDGIDIRGDHEAGLEPSADVCSMPLRSRPCAESTGPFLSHRRSYAAGSADVNEIHNNSNICCITPKSV